MKSFELFELITFFQMWLRLHEKRCDKRFAFELSQFQHI